MRARWVLVGAVVLLVGVPVALTGLYATGDLCPPPADVEGRYDGYENVVETLVVRCTGSTPAGAEIETTQVNWQGGGAALLFLVGLFFAAGGVVGVIDRRLAAIVAGTCALGCLAITVTWFTWG